MRAAIAILILFTGLVRGEDPKPDRKSAVVAQAESLIDSLTASTKHSNWPRLGSLTDWSISVNTYEHDVPSTNIRDLYYATCKKLDSVYPKKVKTYRWEDQFGWPGQITIVQFRSDDRGVGYLMVGVFEGNDSDSFYFRYVKDGECDVSKRKKRDDWNLGTILRCNHKRAEQVGADQPATAVESKPEGSKKPKSESEGRSQ